MTIMQPELEKALRAAPAPTPPAGLREQLIREVRLPKMTSGTPNAHSPLSTAGWLRRWWPVLAPATASVALAIGLSVQQVEIQSLKKTVQEFTRAASVNAGGNPVPTVRTTAASAPDSTAATQAEIARLKELAARLTAEVAELERLRGENAKLRNQLSAPPPGLLTAEETEALAQAKERAECIACVNNLKQFGLAVRLWAVDNGDQTPPDIVCMSNELSTPKILVCPADKGRTTAKDFGSFTTSDCTYEYLAPSAPDNEPTRVLVRCPVHGNIGLCDGSVQREVAKQHPELLIQRNGKLYMDEPTDHLPRTHSPQPNNSPRGGSNR